MASSVPLFSSALITPKPLLLPHSHSSFSLTLHTFSKSIKTPHLKSSGRRSAAAFDMTLFDRDLGGGDTPPPPAEDDKAAEPQCPPGLRQYETMVVLRPDMSEDERLAFTHKFEELLLGGGAMYVEVLNRGVIPLSYGIRKKNKAGETNTYLDGIYLLFTYFTKPESISILGVTLLADDNVIRSSSFKIRKRKLF